MVKDFTRAKEARTFNRVYASGKVVRYGSTASGIATFVLLIRGMPTAGHPAENTLLDIAYGKAMKDHPNGIKIGSTVEVEGHIVGYTYWDEFSSVWAYIQYTEASRIRVLKPEIDEVFGLSGGFAYERPYARVYLKGEIAKILRGDSQNSSGWTNMAIRTGTSPRKGEGVIRVQFSSRMRVNDVGKKCEEGDRVCLTGIFFKKTKRGKDGVPRYFENIIVDDMLIVEKKSAENAAEPPVQPEQKVTDGTEAHAAEALPADVSAQPAQPAEAAQDEPYEQGSDGSTDAHGIESLLNGM